MGNFIRETAPEIEVPFEARHRSEEDSHPCIPSIQPSNPTTTKEELTVLAELYVCTYVHGSRVVCLQELFFTTYHKGEQLNSRAAKYSPTDEDKIGPK